MSKIVYIEKQDYYATLTTWVYCAFHMMYTAERKGLTPYINWPINKCLHAYMDMKKYESMPNMFEWYFKQPFIANPQSRDITWTWEYENWGSNTEHVDYGFISKPLSEIREYYHKYLHFSDAVNTRGEALVRKYDLDLSKTIGISWRGTDIYLDGRPRIPIESYFPWIDKILEQTPDMRIACTAEEEGILNPLLQRYSNSFIIADFYMSPNNSKHNPERFSPFSGYERGMQPALMVWLFSKCAHYIKNRSSVAAVASWISDGKIYSIGHPETLGFPANTNTVEFEGNLYPMSS